MAQYDCGTVAWDQEKEVVRCGADDMGNRSKM